MRRTIRLDYKNNGKVLLTNPDYEQFAYLYSKSISDEEFADEDQHIDKYVEIQYRKKKIYRNVLRIEQFYQMKYL